MHHPLRDAFVVEVEDLLAQHEVLEQRRTRCTGTQAVLVVRDGDALGRGQPLAVFGVLASGLGGGGTSQQRQTDNKIACFAHRNA
jgi:hypothetical protein